MRLVACLMLALLLTACGDDDDPRPDLGPDKGVIDLGIDSSTPDSAQPDLTQPDLGPAPSKLTSSHTGWIKALCFTCHDGTTGKYPHGSESYDEPKCAECHGYNGAPHKDHATTGNSGCMGCHGTTTDNHASSFSSPGDCVACHFHPGT